MRALVFSDIFGDNLVADYLITPVCIYRFSSATAFLFSNIAAALKCSYNQNPRCFPLSGRFQQHHMSKRELQTSQLASCSSEEKGTDDHDGDNNNPEKHGFPFSERVKILLSPTELEFPMGVDGGRDEIYAGDFVSYIPDDVALHIFSFLDTSRAFYARLKLVSKAWNALLSTRWSQMLTKSTLFGLVVCRISYRFNTSFLQLSHSGAAESYFISNTDFRYLLVDSNKGLLLFVKRNNKELMVNHSSTGVLDHLPCEFMSISEKVVHRNHGLIPESHGCYKVVTLFIPSTVGTLFLKTFSSDTKEIKMVKVAVPEEVVVSPCERVTAFLPFKGMLYYSILDWLFVYQLKDGCSTFIKLPVSGCVIPKIQRVMWQSEGRLYYAFGHSDPQPGFQIWELVLEQQHAPYSFEGIKRSSWKMICSHFLADIKNKYTRLFENDKDIHSDLSVCKPCAFNDDFQILYIELQGMILSYHLNTRLFTGACRFGYKKSYWHGRDIFPFSFGSEEDSSIMDDPERNIVFESIYRVQR